MSGTTYEINGVHIYSMTNYYFIVKTEDVENLTAAVNNDLLLSLSDKIDPSIIDAVGSATDVLNSVSTC